MNYPVRARIVDVAGDTRSAAARLYGALGFQLNTPAVSKPYVGEEGLAELIEMPLDEEAKDILRNQDDSKWDRYGLPKLSEEEIASLTTKHVRITLDSGHIIWGYECWWEPADKREG